MLSNRGAKFPESVKEQQRVQIFDELGGMDIYPIGRLIGEAMKSQGMERKDLVKALGYVNLNKGRRNPMPASTEEIVPTIS